MSEEFKRDKAKTFKATEETLKKVDELIKKSGKGPTEFFEDLVQDLAINQLTDENKEEISEDLRKHFQSDVQKLKNATSSILSIFISQMENVSVEKNRWQGVLDKAVGERDEQIRQLQDKISRLAASEAVLKNGYSELTKEKETLQKEYDALQKQAATQEILIQGRDKEIQALSEGEKKLLQANMEKEELLKEVEPIRKEKERLEQEVIRLKERHEAELVRQNEKHKNELASQESALNLECDRSKLNLKEELTEKHQREKEDLRKEVRERSIEETKEFYLGEIRRREDEWKVREKELLAEIEKIRNESKPKRQRNDEAAE